MGWVFVGGIQKWVWGGCFGGIGDGFFGFGLGEFGDIEVYFWGYRLFVQGFVFVLFLWELV